MTSQFTYELLVVPALLAVLLLGRLRLRRARRARAEHAPHGQRGRRKASAYLRVRFEPKDGSPG